MFMSVFSRRNNFMSIVSAFVWRQIDSVTGVIKTAVDLPTACGNCSNMFFNLTAVATDAGGLTRSVPVSVYVGIISTISSTVATDRCGADLLQKVHYYTSLFFFIISPVS